MGDWGKLSSSEPQYTHASTGVKCQTTGGGAHQRRTPQVPAEKGMKASCLTKRPWASRKCSGWKRKGFSQMVSSFSTDDSLPIPVSTPPSMPRHSPAWLEKAAQRYEASSVTHCSSDFLPRPKLRMVDTEKRLCSFQARP
ncbi:hypothetical protein MC885_014459 [Smutsia gigantea]|nr:hypothetical protein MC885_014459 [Smutsia gigantea]